MRGCWGAVAGECLCRTDKGQGGLGGRTWKTCAQKGVLVTVVWRREVGEMIDGKNKELTPMIQGAGTSPSGWVQAADSGQPLGVFYSRGRARQVPQLPQPGGGREFFSFHLVPPARPSTD